MSTTKHHDGHARWRLGPVRLRVHRRSAWVGLALLLLMLAATVVALVIPGAGLSAGDALQVLLGRGGAFHETVVFSWRAPRVVAAIAVGAALALSGGLFQSLTRNPLGSPDVIGFNSGAFTGVLLAMLAGATSFAATATGAFVGGMVTALAIYLLSLRRGQAGLRMVVVGLGVSAMLAAVNRYLLSAADLDTSLQAATWGAGSLNGLRWGQVAPAAALLLVLLVLGGLLARRTQALDLGHDAAAGLGLSVPATRLLLLAVGVGLTAITTAVAGPIAFVALAAPHIARAVTGGARLSPLPVCLTGALVVLVSDILGQRLFDPTQLPVGLVTVTLGGVYLITLLAKEARR